MKVKDKKTGRIKEVNYDEKTKKLLLDGRYNLVEEEGTVEVVAEGKSSESEKNIKVKKIG